MFYTWLGFVVYSVLYLLFHYLPQTEFLDKNSTIMSNTRFGYFNPQVYHLLWSPVSWEKVTTNSILVLCFVKWIENTWPSYMIAFGISIYCILYCKWFLSLNTTEGHLAHPGSQKKKVLVCFPFFFFFFGNRKMHSTGILWCISEKKKEVFCFLFCFLNRNMFVLLDAQEGLDIWGEDQSNNLFLGRRTKQAWNVIGEKQSHSEGES